MKRLSAVLALFGVVVVIAAIVYEQLGGARVTLGGVKIFTTQLLLLSVFLIVTGLVVKLAGAAGRRTPSEPDTRGSFWIIIAVILGAFALWEVGARKMFSREEIVEQF